MYLKKTQYDSDALRRMRSFFVLTISIIEERRANPHKPVDYQEPDWEYRYIKEAIVLTSKCIDQSGLIDDEDNNLLVDAFEVAGRIFHSRIMSLHNYHIETRKMVDKCNNNEKDYPTNLILRLGAFKKRAA